MADLVCSFLYFRSLSTNYSLPLFLRPKRYHSSALHSHNSRITRIKRCSPHLLLLFKPSPFAPSASDIDIISTLEHSDGSLLFRFGDPSEIQKTVEMEEPKTVKEEIEGENKNGSSVVKVKEGDDETEVIASGLTEASDGADSIVSSSNIVIAVEGESEFSERLVKDDTELPVLTSNKEMGGISTLDLDIERIENVEDINEGYKDSSPVGASIPDGSLTIDSSITKLEMSSEESLEETSNITSTSKETEITSIPGVDEEQLTVNVEECLDQEGSPADASTLDQSSEVVGNVTIVALSEKESDGIISSDIDTDQSGKVEEGLNEDHEDSPVDASVLDKSSEVVNGTSTVALEKETDGITSTSYIEIEPSGNVEEGINEGYEDSPADTSVLDKRSEVLNIITTEASSAKETANITSAPDIDIEHAGNVEQGLDEVLEEPSSVDASRPDKRPEVENDITAWDVLGKETADATTLVAFKTDPLVAVLDTDSYQGSLETAVTTNAAPISEYQNVETVILDETIGDGGESFDDNLVSPSPQLEPAMSLYKETEEPIVQAELQTLATEESSETDVNKIKAIEMQNVLSNDNESDMYGAEAESPTMEPSMAWSIGSEEQASGSGSGMPNETVGYVSEKDMIQLLTVPPQLETDSMLVEETGTETVEEPRDDVASENQTVGGDLVEASVHEVIASQSTESTIKSQEMLMTDFVLSSGAALLPHPSKVLTGGEDAYFIAGQTWLGLADGVSQWSLEGTIEGVYAQELIKNCEKLVSDCSGNSINNPIELLNLSAAQTHSPGSSTVLIAQFDGQALRVANVGDSGFLVVRHGAVYKRSSPMHHAFSLPVHIERGDDPSCVAQLYRVDLEEEDLLVLATDGLLDNLYDQEISLIALKSLADHKSPEEIAELLAKRAQEVGSSASARSPFADDAQAAGFPGYSGGKLDDVAVIVSVVFGRRR